MADNEEELHEDEVMEDMEAPEQGHLLGDLGLLDDDRERERREALEQERHEQERQEHREQRRVSREQERLDEERRSAEVVCPIRRAYLRPSVTVDDVRAVVERDPNALMRRDVSKWLPVHWAIEEFVDASILRYLMDQCPESLRQPTLDYNKYLPIHVACSLCWLEDEVDMSSVADIVRIILERAPETAQARNGHGLYPLENLTSGDRFPVARTIIEVWPRAIDAAYENGTLLLHEALEFAGYSEEVVSLDREWVQFLVARRPRSVRERDSSGRIALHCANHHVPPDVVMFLLQEWEDSIRQTDSGGFLLLHNAHAFRYWEDEEWQQLLNLHVQRSPESVRVRANNGSTPLSEAAEWGLSLPKIRALVDLWPESVRERDNRGRLPIHRLFNPSRSSRSMNQLGRVALFLIEQYPESLNKKTDEGDRPLHLLMRISLYSPAGMTTLVELVLTTLLEIILDRAPRSARIPNYNRAIPLQNAVRNAFPIAILRRLVNAWPKSCDHRDHAGMAALHIAVARGEPSLEHVDFLVRRRPESIQFVTHNGSTALHLALARRTPLMNLVIFLVERNRNSLLIGDERGMKPVHIAAAHNGSPEALQYLIEQEPRLLGRTYFQYHVSPESVQFRTKNGSTPLHLALAQPAPPMNLVIFLVEKDRDSLQCADNRGMKPVHIAATHNDSIEALQYLIEQEPGRTDFASQVCPESVRCRSDNGSTALHLLLARPEPPLNMVKFLVEKDPRSLQRADDREMRPVHIAAANNASLEALEYLIRKDPSSLTWKDGFGSLALHIAVARQDVSVDVSVGLVRLLVGARPESNVRSSNSRTFPLQQPNGLGYLPLHVAAMNDAPLDVLYYLSRNDPSLNYESRASKKRKR